MPRRESCKRCGAIYVLPDGCPTHGSRRGQEAARKREYESRRPVRATSKDVYDTPAWRRLRKLVIAEEGACQVCGHEGDPSNPLTGGHIVALAKGGDPFERENVRCECRRCNSAKGVS